MEIHPILECSDNISPGLWYVISSENAPEARVGMACVSRKDQSKCESEVFLIGGANPSTTFGDVYKLDLKTFSWSKICKDGFRSRYEHTAFIPSSTPKTICAFGGADESGNLNSMQLYNTKSGEWSDLTGIQNAPSPRTMHSAGWVGDKLYVYSGGHQGADPVTDKALHEFCFSSKTWSAHQLSGDIPSPRHGHVMAVLNSKLYIHGGMAGVNFYDDLFQIDLSNFESLQCKKRKIWPCARAAHSIATYGNKLYIFGGMCLQGALDDMYYFDDASLSWTLMKFDCPAPPPRLDHSMVSTMLPVKKSALNCDGGLAMSKKSPDKKSIPNAQKPNIVAIDDWKVSVDGATESVEKLDLNSSSGEAQSVESVTVDPNEYEFVPVCIVVGGMDTGGNVFNDVFVTKMVG